jgi:hypothetical protein
MAKSTYGISKAQMGAAGANGVMGGTLTNITRIVADSVQVQFPEPTQTPLTAEEDNSPFANLKTPTPKKIVLKSHNVAVADMTTIFGGAVVTASGVSTFTPGVQFEIPNQSFSFTTRVLNGVKQAWNFPLTDLVVSVDSNPSKTNTMQLTFTFTVLQPYDGSGVALADFGIVETVV